MLYDSIDEIDLARANRIKNERDGEPPVASALAAAGQVPVSASGDAENQQLAQNKGEAFRAASVLADLADDFMTTIERQQPQHQECLQKDAQIPSWPQWNMPKQLRRD